jgi:calcium/calmodulin-dependent protein kinase I
VKEREFLREEIQIIRNIRHPNVVVMKEVYETLGNMYIMMECMMGGELFDHIKDYEITGKH